MNRNWINVVLCFAIGFGVLVLPSLASADTGKSATLVNQAEPLNAAEISHYGQLQRDADAVGTLEVVGGTEDSTGTIILATIGVLVLVGAAMAAAAA